MKIKKVLAGLMALAVTVTSMSTNLAVSANTAEIAAQAVESKEPTPKYEMNLDGNLDVVTKAGVEPIAAQLVVASGGLNPYSGEVQYTADKYGNSNQAVDLDGKYGILLDNVDVDRTYSVSFRVKREDYGQNSPTKDNTPICMVGEKNVKDNWVTLAGASATQYKLWTHDNNGAHSAHYRIGDPFDSTNAWTHYTITVNGSVVKLYQGGERILADATININTDNKLRIILGANYWPGDGMPDCCIDEVKIFDEVLTAVEARALNNDGFALGGTRAVRVGGVLELEHAIFNPEGKSIVWTSQDPGIATVEDGVVTGVSEGYVDIKAELKNSQGETIATSSRNIVVLGEVEGGLIADFSFDDAETGLVGAGAKATIQGTGLSFVEVRGRKALRFDGSASWLDVTKEDGSSLLSGVKEMTISYDSFSEGAFMKNWAFYAAKSNAPGSSRNTPYIAVSDYPDHIDAIRGSGQTHSGNVYQGWKHIDIVFGPNDTGIYVNGELQSTVEDLPSISEILGDKNYAMIGKALWGDGEYWQGYMDNFKIYDYALTQQGILSGPIQSVDVSSANGSSYMFEGEELQLSATVSPSYAVHNTITWSSSDEKVATVDEHGKVTAVGVGNATITAHTHGIQSEHTGTMDISVNEKKVIADFDFDDEESGFKGAGAVAKRKGNSGFLVEYDGGTALEFNGEEGWLDLEAEDGSSLMGGLREFTVSYDNISEGAPLRLWVFYISQKTGTNSASGWDYLAVGDYTDSMIAARLNSSDLYARYQANTWKHVDVVFGINETRIYINGVQAAVEDSTARTVAEVIGSKNYPMIGKANWGNGAGEFWKGKIDNFKIYNYARTAQEIADIPISHIKVTAENPEVTLGEELQLSAVITPSAAAKPVTWSSSNTSIATVDENGKVTPVAPGKAVITAEATDKDGRKTGTIEVTVKDYEIASVKANVPEGAETAMKIGDMLGLSATVEPGALQEKAQISWTSDNPAVASVDGTGTVTAQAAGTAKITVTASYGGKSVTDEITVTAEPREILAESVTITGDAQREMVVGDKGVLSATVLPENATNKAVVWTSSNNAVVSVDADGAITAKAAGQAEVTATAADGSGKSASVAITVKEPVVLVSKIEIANAPEIMEVGETAALSAAVFPENATDKAVAWTSSNPEVLSVNANGTVEAKAAGEAVITVTAMDASGTKATVAIKVQLPIVPVEKITITGAPESMGVGNTADLSVAVLPENATNKAVTWVSSNPEIISVDGNGRIEAKAEGNAVITATSADNPTVADTVTIIVQLLTVPVESIVIADAPKTMKVGEKAVLSATVLPENATNKAVAWASSNPEIISVVNGEIEAKAPGSAEITATATDGSGKACMVQIPVSDYELESVEIGVNNGEGTLLEVGDTLALTVSVKPEALAGKAEITWESGHPEIASVDSESGIVTAKSAGTAKVKATAVYNGKSVVSNEITVTVTAIPVIPVDSVAIAGAPQREMMAGSLETLSVSVLPANATNPAVIWSSSDESTVSVDDKGIISAKKEGVAIITATAADGSGKSASVTVTVKEKRYQVTVVNGTIQDGKTQYKYGEKAVVIAEAATEAGNFVGWKNADGKYVCYSIKYSFAVLKDVEVIAEYAKEEVKKEVVLNCSVTYDASQDKMIFTGERVVPSAACEGGKVIAHGIILTATEDVGTDEGKFQLDGNKVTDSRAKDTFGLLGTYTVTVKGTSGRVYYARSYVTYIDAETKEKVTKYSNIIQIVKP